MQAKPTLYDSANYFQQQANRTRDLGRKAHYQRCADLYLVEAKRTEPEKRLTQPTVNQIS